MNSRCLIFLMILVSRGNSTFSHNNSFFSRNETIDNSVLPRTSEKPVQSFDPERVIQIGAFRLEPNAVALKSKLSTLIKQPVMIVQKDGYFKVQLTGFENQEEIGALLPILGLLGIKNIWVIPEKKQKEAKPQIVMQADTLIRLTMVNLTLPVLAEFKPLTSLETFALQIGVFHNKSKALRARKKIMTRLKLPVKVVQEWEYYKVFVTGFFSIEATYNYYPKLAAMGYPNIMVIEAYK